MIIIDSHIHCGIQNSNLPYESVKTYLDEANISGACLFAPVEDIYDRYQYEFEDSSSWMDCRQRANDYLLDIRQSHENTFAYYFVWNDFRKDELKKGYQGIKWHRHENEPVYEYNNPRCEDFLVEAYRLRLPIVLEETFENTHYLINRISSRTTVIIPHLGMLNGGFESLFNSGIWDNEQVYADTALAAPYEIKMFLDRYGSGRLFYGSDFPFGLPYLELNKIEQMNLQPQDFENIVSKNILKLMNT